MDSLARALRKSSGLNSHPPDWLSLGYCDCVCSIRLRRVIRTAVVVWGG